MLRVYPGLQLLSPLVTVEDILTDEFEESFGEVVKFRDGVALDLMSKNKHLSEKDIPTNDLKLLLACSAINISSGIQKTF